MPQTKDQKRRNAIDLKRASVAQYHNHIGILRSLILRGASDADNALLKAYVHEGRIELVANLEQKIRTHERDIANTEARLSL